MLVTLCLLQACLSQKLYAAFIQKENITGEIHHLVHEWSTDSSRGVKSSPVISPDTLFKAGGSSSPPRPPYPKSLRTIPFTRELYNKYQGVAEHCVGWRMMEEFCGCLMLRGCCDACAREGKLQARWQSIMDGTGGTKVPGGQGTSVYACQKMLNGKPCPEPGQQCGRWIKGDDRRRGTRCSGQWNTCKKHQWDVLTGFAPDYHTGHVIYG